MQNTFIWGPPIRTISLVGAEGGGAKHVCKQFVRKIESFEWINWNWITSWKDPSISSIHPFQFSWVNEDTHTEWFKPLIHFKGQWDTHTHNESLRRSSACSAILSLTVLHGECESWVMVRGSNCDNQLVQVTVQWVAVCSQSWRQPLKWILSTNWLKKNCFAH